MPKSLEFDTFEEFLEEAPPYVIEAVKLQIMHPGWTKVVIAHEIGVHRDTLYQWTDAMSEAIRMVATDTIKATVAMMKKATARAWLTLEQCMSSADERVKIRAAESALDFTKEMLEKAMNSLERSDTSLFDEDLDRVYRTPETFDGKRTPQ
jgi:DNA-binding transcriptional regulator GbsR (MarR family)